MGQREEIALAFKYEGAESAEALKQRHAELNEQAQKLAIQVGKNEITWQEYRKQVQEVEQQSKALERAIGTLTAAEQAQAAAADKAADAQHKVGQAAGASAQSARQAQQGFLDITRAASDWATGGFLGVVNNLEGIGRAIPALLKNPMALLSGLPAILTAVGTALYLFGGKVYDAFKYFALGSNEIPKAADALKRVEGELGEVTKKLDAYREKQRLTNGELADYNKLSERQIELERRKAEELKKQADLEKLRKLKGPGEEEAEKERADIVQGAVGGQQNAVSGALGEVLGEQDRQRMFNDRRVLEGQIASSAPGVNRNALQRQLDALNKRLQRSLRGELFKQFQAQAEGMLAAAAQGDQTEILRALGLMGQGDRFDVGGDLEMVRQGFEAATPAGARARREEKQSIERQQHDAKLAAEMKQKQEQAERQAEHERKQREHDQKEQDKAAEDRAKRMLENPGAHSPEELALARAVLGGDEAAKIEGQAERRAGGGHAPAAPRPAAVQGVAAGLPGGAAMMWPWPGPMGAPGAAPAVVPALPDLAAIPPALPAAPNPFAGLKGTKLKRARRAARKQARKDAADLQATRRRFANAARKPIQSTVIPGGQAKPAVRSAIVQQAARDAAAPVSAPSVTQFTRGVNAAGVNNPHPAAAGPPGQQPNGIIQQAQQTGSVLQVATQQAQTTGRLMAVIANQNAMIERLRQRVAEQDRQSRQLIADQRAGGNGP